MPPPRFPVPQGALDILTFHILSLKPALHRLRQKGWVPGAWKQSETDREARLYSIAPAGRRQLAVEKDSWASLSDAVKLIFEEGSR